MTDKNFSSNNTTKNFTRKRGRMFYGREPLKPTQDDEKLFGTVSYKTATVGSASDDDESEIERLSGI